MLLDFEKWHGCLNDFVVTWISDLDGDVVLDSLKRQAVALCDRRAGIGADGILVLQTRRRDELTPYRMTIINSDGSIARNCGNGVRCASLAVLKRHKEKGDPGALPEAVELDVEGRALVGRFLRASGPWPHVAVEMGVPVVGDDVPWADDARRAVADLGARLALPAVQRAEVGVCDVGNPHVVITTDAASRDLALKLGPALQKHAAWDGMNVHVVAPVEPGDKDQARAGAEVGGRLSELHRAYVWERGAGETPACGSGACAVAACSLATGLTPRDQWIGVDMPGGRLYVKHAAADEPIVLAGPGAFVYSGRFMI